MWPFKKKNQSTLSAEEMQLRTERRAEFKELDDARRAADMRIMLKEKELEELQIDAEIAELQADLGVDEPEDMFEGFFKNAAKALMPKMQSISSPVAVSASQQTQQVITLSDEQLSAQWAQVSPMYKAIAKQMTDEQLRDFIIGRMPQVDAETVARAIKLVRQ